MIDSKPYFTFSNTAENCSGDDAWGDVETNIFLLEKLPRKIRVHGVHVDVFVILLGSVA